jgi:hypothetical protein
MSNPKNKHSEEDFLNKVKATNPNIKILGKYTGVENKIDIECNHNGGNSVYAYTLLKPRNCCRKAYHANRVPALKKDINVRKSEIKKIFGEDIDVSNISFDSVNRAKIVGLICKEHGEFDQWVHSLLTNIGCPICGLLSARPNRIKQAEKMRQKAVNNGKAKFVSKVETTWLDELNVPIRQYWLEDVKYRVDGFNPITNTVYLFHGRFWHGCPETYDREEIHPILKVKMKQLYEQTLSWENKIKEAGYTLITKWG